MIKNIFGIPGKQIKVQLITPLKLVFMSKSIRQLKILAEISIK
ncbi:hypothetical protein [Leptospira noguchii]|nr:hypothetical protein [Leptospira noguchii]